MNKPQEQRTEHPYWIWEAIMNTPDILKACLDEPVLGQVNHVADRLNKINPSHIFITGTGSSHFVALAEAYAFEEIASISASAHVTTELWAHPPAALAKNNAWLFNSHSGGTYGDSKAVELARERGVYTVGITDIPDSTLDAITDDVIIGPGGPKHELPATRTYSAALYRVIQLAIALAERHGFIKRAEEYQQELERIPHLLREVVASFAPKAPDFVDALGDRSSFTVIGSGSNFATAHEAALGLSESQAAPAQAFMIEDWLHGPIQTLTNKMCLIAIASPGPLQSRVLQAVSAARIIGAKTLVLIPADTKAQVDSDLIIKLPPHVPELLTPLLYISPLWQMSYFFALRTGHNPDRLSMDKSDFKKAFSLLMPKDEKFTK